jgi:Mg2+/Co2+ transporter CorB
MCFGSREIAYIILLVIIVLISAFFSGSETAFMRVNRIRIRSLAEKKNKDALRVDAILKDPEKLLSTLLLGTNFVNILGSAIATALFLSVFGDRGSCTRPSP